MTEYEEAQVTQAQERTDVLDYGDAVGDYVIAWLPDAEMLLAETLVSATVALLGECTPEQLALFDRVQPNYPCTTSVVKLTSAYELARRTVLKNRERGSDHGK